ncbi:MAG: hypothetical protein AB7U75_21355 [Hyphomicrobiaceae bacterium]
MVANPIDPISQDADIAPSGGLGLRLDVTGKLFKSLGLSPCAAEIALHFDDGGAHFNVDSTPVSERGFQIDLLHIVLVQLERGGEDQLTDISLDIRFCAMRVSAHETGDYVGKQLAFPHRSAQISHWQNVWHCRQPRLPEVSWPASGKRPFWQVPLVAMSFTSLIYRG